MAEKTTILDMNRFDDSNLDGLDENKRELVRRRRILGKGYRLFYKDPVEIVRGKGSHVFDEKGNDYLDAYNNVVSVGHCHPHVVEAIAKQAATLNTHTRYLHETILDYSEALIAKMPREIDRITYQCTGSEANDLPSHRTKLYRRSWHHHYKRGLPWQHGEEAGRTGRSVVQFPCGKERFQTAVRATGHTVLGKLHNRRDQGLPGNQFR